MGLTTYRLAPTEPLTNEQITDLVKLIAVDISEELSQILAFLLPWTASMLVAEPDREGEQDGTEADDPGADGLPPGGDS